MFDPASDPLDERTLVLDAKAGKRRSFEEIIRRHSGRLLRLARRNIGDPSEAEDIVQEVFARAWRKIDTFDDARPLEPWLTRITLNACRDRQRHNRVRSFLLLGRSQDASLAEPLSPIDPSLDLIQRDLMRRVGERIARLPAKLREPFVLVTLEAHSQAEAGSILGISEKAVETRIYRARNLLRSAFEGHKG